MEFSIQYSYGSFGQLKFRLGLIADEPDPRDLLLSEVLGGFTGRFARRLSRPPLLDLTKKMSPVRDQGNENTCVGFAVVAVKEWDEKKKRKKVILSPRFIYCQARKIPKAPSTGGTSIRNALRVLQNQGVCTEKCFPYKPHSDEDPFGDDYVEPCTAPGDNPCAKAQKEAAKYKIPTYLKLADANLQVSGGLDNIKQSLHMDGPCVLGVLVYEKWMKSPTQKDGIIKMPSPNERDIGLHAVCAVGYDDQKKLVKFKNSWGIKWGDKGYGYLPYDYFDYPKLDVAWAASKLLKKGPKALLKRKEAFMKEIRSNIGNR